MNSKMMKGALSLLLLLLVALVNAEPALRASEEEVVVDQAPGTGELAALIQERLTSSTKVEGGITCLTNPSNPQYQYSLLETRQHAGETSIPLPRKPTVKEVFDMLEKGKTSTGQRKPIPKSMSFKGGKTYKLQSGATLFEGYAKWKPIPVVKPPVIIPPPIRIPPIRFPWVFLEEGTSEAASAETTVEEPKLEEEVILEADKLNTIPLPLSIWAAETITIESNTKILIPRGVTSFYIMARTLKIGDNVAITYEKPNLQIPLDQPDQPQYPGTGPRGTSNYCSTPGANGYAGCPGLSPPLDGVDAPGLEVIAWEINQLFDVFLAGQDGPKGGKGGRGGQGQNGGRGRSSDSSLWICTAQAGSGCNGGKGGPGGIGGRGGNGGDGGYFRLQTSATTLARGLGAHTILLRAGRGGQGGDGGEGGAGGAGGDKGNTIRECPRNSRPPGSTGAHGAGASMGARGTDGRIYINNYAQELLPESSGDELVERFRTPYVSCIALEHSRCEDHRGFLPGQTIAVYGYNFHDDDVLDFMVGGFDVVLTQSKKSSFTSDNYSVLYFTMPDNVWGDPAVRAVVRWKTGAKDRTGNNGRGPYKGVSNAATLYVRPQIKDVQQFGKSIVVRNGQSVNKARQNNCISLHGHGFSKRMKVMFGGYDVGQQLNVVNHTFATAFFEMPRTGVTAAGKAKDEDQLAVTVQVQSGPPGTIEDSRATATIAADTFVMLVFGDSVTWNQGVRESLKSYTTIFNRFSTYGNQQVNSYLHVFAHSGAPLINDLASNLKMRTNSKGEYIDNWRDIPAPEECTACLKEHSAGEISRSYPSVTQQIDMYQGDPKNVDLIYLGGCANDIGLENVVASRDSVVRKYAELSCRTRLKDVVRKVRTKYPHAILIYHGYYYALAGPSDMDPEKLAKLNLSSYPSMLTLLANTAILIWGTIQFSLVKIFAANALLHYAAQEARQGAQKLIASQDRAMRDLANMKDLYYVRPKHLAERDSGAFGKDSRVWEVNLPLPSINVEDIKSLDHMFDWRKSNCKRFGYKDLKCRIGAVFHPNPQAQNDYGKAAIAAVEHRFKHMEMPTNKQCTLDRLYVSTAAEPHTFSP